MVSVPGTLYSGKGKGDIVKKQVDTQDGYRRGNFWEGSPQVTCQRSTTVGRAQVHLVGEPMWCEPRQPARREEWTTQRPCDRRGEWVLSDRKKAHLAAEKTAPGQVEGENKDGWAGPRRPWERGLGYMGSAGSNH